MVFLLVWLGHDALSIIVAILAAALGLLVVQRRPAAAVTVLLLGLVFNTIILATLFRVGLPGSVVRALGYWKEGLIAGALVAVLRDRSRRRLDALDVAALAYVVLGMAYLLAPGAFLDSKGGTALTFSDRLLGWRSDVFYVLIFLIFRHLRLGRVVVDRILRRFLVVAVIAALVGIFEFLASGTWNTLAVHGFSIQNYKHVVLHQQVAPGFSLSDVRVYGTLAGHHFVRVGSVLFDYLGIGFIFAIGLGTAAELVARGQARRWVYAGFPLLGIALLLTQTRSAIIAGVLATVLALRHRVGRSLPNRARLAHTLAVALLLCVAIAVPTGVLSRFSGDTGSNAVHDVGLHKGIDIMAHAPLGRGLSTAAGGGQLVAQRQGQGNPAEDVVTETQYLQIGTQLGYAGLMIYALVLLLLLRRLLNRSSDDPLAVIPGAMSNVAVGTLIGAIFIQPFAGLQVAWIFWGLAALAVSVVDDHEERRNGLGLAPDRLSTSGGTATMRPIPT